MDDRRELVGDELLIAGGHRDRTNGIGLETVGQKPGGDLEVTACTVVAPQARLSSSSTTDAAPSSAPASENSLRGHHRGEPQLVEQHYTFA